MRYTCRSSGRSDYRPTKRSARPQVRRQSAATRSWRGQNRRSRASIFCRRVSDHLSRVPVWSRMASCLNRLPISRSPVADQTFRGLTVRAAESAATLPARASRLSRNTVPDPLMKIVRRLRGRLRLQRLDALGFHRHGAVLILQRAFDQQIRLIHDRALELREDIGRDDDVRRCRSRLPATETQIPSRCRAAAA